MNSRLTTGEPGSVTQSFKGHSAFSFQTSATETKHEAGRRFLKRFKLTVRNNKNISFQSILDPQEMMPLPESHVSALFCMLVMLVEWPASAIVYRYTSNNDGVAACWNARWSSARPKCFCRV